MSPSSASQGRQSSEYAGERSRAGYFLLKVSQSEIKKIKQILENIEYLRMRGLHDDGFLVLTDMDENSPIYLESIIFDQKTERLFLTSGKSGSIFTISTSHPSKLEKYISSSKLSPSGITIDPCSR